MVLESPGKVLEFWRTSGVRTLIPCTSPPGCLYSEGWFNGEFFMLRFWGAYTWRGLFSEFYGIFSSLQDIFSEITLKSQKVGPKTTETKEFTKEAWLKTQSALPSEWGLVILLDCKTVGFFLKISKEIGRVLRARSARASHALRACDCSPVLEYAKIRTVLQSKQ